MNVNEGRHNKGRRRWMAVARKQVEPWLTLIGSAFGESRSAEPRIYFSSQSSQFSLICPHCSSLCSNSFKAIRSICNVWPIGKTFDDIFLLLSLLASTCLRNSTSQFCIATGLASVMLDDGDMELHALTLPVSLKPFKTSIVALVVSIIPLQRYLILRNRLSDA